MNLEGRVAIVTGGGRHLGRASALGLGRASCAVLAAGIMDAIPVAEEIV